MGKDYYEVLGIPRTASESEIKSAYKKLAKQWHPDVSKEANATEKFKEISEAYQVLSNPEKRQTYDQFGSDAFSGGFPGGQGGGFPGGFGDFSDFFNGGFANASGMGGFEDILRQAFGEQGGFGAPRENLNIRGEVNLTFEEAAFGAKKKISLKRSVSCSKCEGTGSQSGKKETCTHCKGRGMETHTRRTAFGMFQTSMPCTHCRGSGQMVKDPCETCNGKGVQTKTSDIEIDFPAGIDHGQHIRLSGQGNASSSGKKGDLYVIVHVEPHDVFRRDGFDVLIEQPISFADAALGGEVEIPTLHGDVTLTIPPGTETGKVFRVKGKGIPHLNKSGNGDEYVQVQIQVPNKLSKKEKELLEELRSLEKGETKTTSKSKKKGFFGL